jgi:hypothetical protein
MIPLDSRHIDRFYFYGWNITLPWLADLSRRYRFPTMFRSRREPADGLRFLRTIYKDLHLVHALVEPGETYEYVYPGYNGDQMTIVVAVYVNIHEYQHRRATERQLQQLIKVFGKEPKWFKDGWTMEHFDDYDYTPPL